MQPFLFTYRLFIIIVGGIVIGNTINCFAQEKETISQLNADNDYVHYSNWSLHVNKTYYMPGSAEKTAGVYNIHPHVMQGFNMGFLYSFNKAKPISYYTGIDINFVPFYKFNFAVATNEFIGDFSDFQIGYEHKSALQVVGSLPIGMAWKHKITNLTKSGGIYLHIKSDVRLHILQSKAISFSYINEGVHFFKFYNYPTTQYQLSPSLNFAAGLDCLTKIALFSIHLNVQKGLRPYMEAGYEFKNLQVSPNTTGKYTFMADYIGIDLGIQFKKWR